LPVTYIYIYIRYALHQQNNLDTNFRGFDKILTFKGYKK